ncbi:MAG: glycosyltransferase [Eubacteriales bacterium]
MKVNFVTATMAGGGTERVIAILANDFVNCNYEVEIITLSDPTISYELDEKIQITRLTERTNGKLIARIRRIILLRKHVKENKGSVYLSFGTETNLFVIIAAAFLNKTLILSERSNPHECKFKHLRDIIYVCGQQFVFQTEDAMLCFSKGIQKKSVVIPNPVSHGIPERYMGIRSKTIVAVGRLGVEKNHKLLIDAFAEFKNIHIDYKLILYGDGDLRDELKEQTRKLSLDNDVIFAGFSNSVLEDIKDAGMYVLSSNYEGISNSLLEAMALGLPVIATDCPIGGARMLIEDGINGMLVPVGNKESMVAAMNKITNEVLFADRISKEAEKVKNQYALEVICQSWKDCIEQSSSK